MAVAILIFGIVCAVVFLIFRDTEPPRNRSPRPKEKEEDKPLPFFAGTLMLVLLLYHSIFSVDKDDKKKDEHKS